MRGRTSAVAVLVLVALAFTALAPALAPFPDAPTPTSAQRNKLSFDRTPLSSLAIPGAPTRGNENGPSTNAVPTSAPAPGTYFDHVVIILMENKAICNILTTCGGTGPFETDLAADYGLATKYVDCGSPSLPNYLCLSGGTTFGCDGYDGNPNSNACTGVAWNSPNIVDRLVAANRTWKAYMEGMPSNCYGSNNGTYLVRHDPFVYYKDIVQNATRCAQVVPARTNDSALLGDLNGTAPNYMWLTPNSCNDMHDCSVAVGDAYLSNLVPQILNTTTFKSSRAALFITFDEDSGGKGAPYLYTVWAGPTAKIGFASGIAYNHYSLLATLEANWELTPLTGNDTSAAKMTEFFPAAPTARFGLTPAWPRVNATITFNASTSTDPNPNATLRYRWDWTNNGTWDTPWSANSSATQRYGSPGAYVARLEVNDSYGLTALATQAFVVDSEPPVTTGNLTGTAGGNGWYRSSVTVTLNATDDLSGVARTNYTVDGGGWQAYSGPFVIGAEASHTVQYYSTDRGGNVESTDAIAFGIDETAPVTNASLSGILNGSLFLTPINVTLDATDSLSGVALTQYRVDAGSWTNYTRPFTVSNRGIHTVRFESTDVAGNVELTHSFLVVNGSVAGIAAPVSTAVIQGTHGSSNWYVSGVNVTLELVNGTSPPDSIWYRLDAGPWTPYTAPVAIGGDGIHRLQYNATNNAGLVEATHNATIRIDTTPPVSNLTLSGTLGRSGWYVSTVSANLSATDAQSGVAAIHDRVDNGSWVTYSGSFALADGRHFLQFYATDVAGVSEAVKSASVSIDTVPPVAASSLAGTAGQGGWYVSNVTATLTASDATSGVANLSYRLDNGSWATYTGSLKLAEGRHALAYYATDVAGLSGAVQRTNVSIDTTPPVTQRSLSGLLGINGTYATNVTVFLNATDNLSGIAKISYQIDNGSWLVYSGPFLITQGHHYVEYDATDIAGLTESVRTVVIVVNIAQPVTTITLQGTLGSNGWYVSNVTVTLNATDASIGIAYISYRVDHAGWTNYSAPFALGEGQHVVEYYAVDRAGHVEPVQSKAVAIDLTPPRTNATLSGTPGNSGWFVSNVTVFLSATDNLSGVANITYRLDNGPWQTYSGPILLGEGRHVVGYRATDRAGLIETVQSVSVSIDTTPPTTSATLAGTLGSNDWYISNVSATLNATDSTSGVASIDYRIDNGTWQAYSGPFVLSDGRHLIEYYATDVAGLSSPMSSTSVQVDTTPPSSRATVSGTVGTNGWYVSNITVIVNATDATSGVAAVMCRVDNGSWATCASSISMTDGRHFVEYYAVDNAGLTESTHSMVLDVDTQPPTTTVAFAGTVGDNGWYASNVTVWLNATDATSGLARISYHVDNGSWITYVGSFILGDGRHLLEYFATDNAGLADAVHSLAFAIDASGPDTTASLTGDPGYAGWYISNVTVTLTATDTSGIVNISYRVDNGSWRTYGSPFNLGEGRHLVEYYATDTAGVVEPVDSTAVSIDTTLPVSTSSRTGTFGNHGWYITNVTVVLSATDATSGIGSILYHIDNGAWLTYSGAFVLGEGRHVVQYRAIDRAGLVEAMNSADIPIDTTPPVTVASLSGTLGSFSWYTSNVTVTILASDAWSGVWSTSYRVDNGSWTLYKGPFVIATGGEHILDFYSIDGAGHQERMESVQVNIETSAPYFLVAPSSRTTISPVSITWQAVSNYSGIAGYAVSVDNGPFFPIGNATHVSLPLAEGMHVIRVKAVDVAGQAAVASISVRVNPPPPGLLTYVVVAMGSTGAAAAWAFAFLRIRRSRQNKGS